VVNLITLVRFCSLQFVEETGVEGVWLPSEIANNLKRENNANVDTNSGAESDFDSDDDDDYDEVLESEDEDGVFIDVEKCTYLRSFPAIQKAFRLLDNDNLEMERIENEHEIYLTNERMRVSRIDIENYLNDDNRQFSVLPEVWKAFGTACAVRYEGILKRAAIVGIDAERLDLLLIDYGINIKSNASEVFSLPNEDVLCAQPSLIVVSLSAFPNCHFSRIQILRQLLPRGSWVHFVKKQKSKETPTKGELYFKDMSSVSDRVIEEISRLRLNIDCRDIVPYPSLPYGQLNPTINNIDNFIFLYKNPSLTLYKKSKLVTSLY
uniref:Tudor domain-containing protein n=1 Tax=Caenorhabditis japonica TaxID=281687 RepID=A0A8R1I4A0_CAEJA